MALDSGCKKFFFVRYSIVAVGSSGHGGSRLALLLGRKEQSMHVNRRFELKIDVIEYSYLIVIYNEEVNVILNIHETLNVMLSRAALARHAN